MANKKTSPLVWIILVIVVLLLGILIYNKRSLGPGQYDSFAQCLTDSGAQMYGAYWCPHCNDQKEMFGNSWQYIDYVECSLPNRAGSTQVCTQANIESYPTWEFGDGSRQLGVMTFEQLSQRTGCPLDPIVE